MDIGQKVIGRLAGHPMGAESSCREILEVSGYDDRGLPSDGGCEHVSIVRIR